MRLSFLMTIVFTLGISGATSYSQHTKIDLDIKNATLSEVLNKIGENTEFSFWVSNDVFNDNQKISLTVKDLPIDKVLELAFKEQNLRYNIKDKVILIYKSTKMNEIAMLQQTRISGTIVDATSGEAIVGANVILEGTTIGVISDVDGKYSIEVPSPNAVLLISFVGYNSERIETANRTIVDVSMIPDIKKLEEIVVIGYGSMKKSDLSGSVVSVKSKDISAYPSLQALQALEGRASGVQIQATNGDPGATYKVRIRGASSVNASSDPLIVVDGFPGAGMPASEDIESIEILKDASATAIYGSRGANGVIMVTTKSGKAGKSKIEFNSSYSVQKVIKNLDLLRTSDFVYYVNEMTPDLLTGTDYPDTDWQDEVFQRGGIQNYQLALSGGNENSRYYVSGIIYDQKGIILDSRYKRYSIFSNLNIHVTKKLDAGVKLSASRYSSNGTITQEWSGGAGQAGVMSATVLTPPIIPIYNANGSYATSGLTGMEADNPVAIAKETALDDVGDNIQLNLYGEYKITDKLKFRSTFGVSNWSGRNGNYLPTSLYGGRSIGGRGIIEGSRSLDVINENYFTFNKNINNVHDIQLMAGYSYQSSTSEYWGARSENYITDAFSFWNLAAGADAKTPSSGLVKSELSSFYGRLNYKLFNRYLITLNARYDGSSRFTKNNKWAFFPSGAVAWDIMQENFMKGIPKISQFKIRTSYGITGNQAIAPYQSLARLVALPSTVINNTIVNSVAPSTVANDNLTWESTAQTNVGLDLGIFKQRVSLVVDYYYKKTTDLLFDMPLPQYSGYSSMLKNIGSLENKGFEFTLSTVNLDNDFKWLTDLNFSFPKNKIVELPDGKDIFVNVSPGHMVGIDNTQVLREGQAMGKFFGYIYDGVYQEGDVFLSGGGFEQVAGGEKFKDLNSDGNLDSKDRTIIGDPNPKFLWGLNNTFEYKGFDLNIFIQASQGNDIYSFTLFELELMSGYNNSTTRALERWTPTNTKTDIPKASSSRSRISSSRFVYDGSYIRVKNLSLGYKLPSRLTKIAGISFARVYLSGQNLFTFSSYPGYDPEVSWMGAGSNISLGLDYGSYPNAKSITIGVQVKF